MTDLPDIRAPAQLDDVPPDLEGLIWREGDALVITEDLQPRFALAAPLVGVGLWVGFAGLVWTVCLGLAALVGFVTQGVRLDLLLGLAPGVWFGGALIALTMAGAGVLLGRPRRLLRIVPTDATEQLVLDGQPGRDLVLTFDHGRSLVFPQVRQRRLTVHAVRWIAQQIAAHTGAVLDDRVDDGPWQTWIDDPLVRSQQYFRQERHENQTRFATRLRISPAQPRDVVFEVGGLTWQQVQVEDGWIHSSNRSIPLRTVHDGYVRSVLHTIELRLLTDQGPVSLATEVYSTQAFSHYRWLAALLLDESRKLRARDRGDASDVPEALATAVTEREER